MFKEIISSKRYWASVLFMGLGFIIIFSVIVHIMQYRGIDIHSFIQDNISDKKWIRYLISRLVGGLIYGMIMSYYLVGVKRKSKR